MMSDGLTLSWPALTGGLVLGMLLAVLYLMALARSVRGLAGSRYPGRRLLLGTLLRLLLMGAVFGGLLYAGDALQALAAVAGFVIVRTAVVRWRMIREDA